MANIQLLSNAASPLKSLLTATNVWSPFEYSVKSSAPNLSRSRVEVKGSAPSNLDKNRTEVFRVPRFGLWSGLTIKIGIRVNCIVPATADATSVKDFSNWLGLFLMQNVTLATHNKVICTIPAEALLFESTYARDSDTRHTLGYLEGENAAGSLYNVVHGQAPADLTKLTYFHIPVPFSCFESTSCYWDTSFVESLQISVQLAEKTSSVMSNSLEVSDWVYESVDCHFDYLAVDDATRKSIQTSNCNIDRGILTMLASNYFQEQSFTTAAVTYANAANVDALDLTVQIRCNGLCSHTFWRLVDVSTNAEYNKGSSLGESVVEYGATGAVETKTAGWTRAVLSASGTTLVDIKVEDTLIGFGGGMSRGLSSTSSATAGQYNTTSSKTDGFNVITWGLDSRATSYDSGSCSFKECVAPTLTVSMAAHKTAARAGVKYRLEVFHKVLVLNSISSSDGRVSQSISI